MPLVYLFRRPMRLDHVIYGTTDLEAAAERVEATLGLPVQPGGHHDGQGSHNRIVPLGPGYLELLAIDDPEEAAASPIGRILQEVITGDGLLAYAVFVDDIDRFGLTVHTRQPRRPDRLGGRRRAGAAGAVPALLRQLRPPAHVAARPRPDVGRGRR